MAVAYQVEYLNLKEIFLYSNLKSFYQWPVNYLNGQLTPVDSINLNISQERYTKLKNDVEISKRLGVIYRDGGGYRKANITFGNKNYPVEIRLKGDELDHVEDNRWSFRVKMMNDTSLFGMRKFSLQSQKLLFR